MTSRRILKPMFALALFATSGRAFARQPVAVSSNYTNASQFVDWSHKFGDRAPVPKMRVEIRMNERSQTQRAILAGRRTLGPAASWTGHQIAHTSQTMLLLWTLAAVEGVMHEHHLAPLKEKSEDWREVIKRAGDGLVNNTGLYASMLGAGGVSTLAALPVGMLNQQILSVAPNKFGGLLAGYAGSFVSFVGWELGSRMWDEAIYNLTLLEDGQTRTPAEQKQIELDVRTAQNLRFLDVMTGRASADETRVFGMVMNNALELLMFTHPERTSNWISNTLRLNIMTGDFFTVLTTMTVAGTFIGFETGNPIGGFLIGGASGIVGGIAAHFVPELQKRRITDGLRNVYYQAADLKFRNNAAWFEEIRGVYAFHGPNIRPTYVKELERALAQRRKVREDYGTVAFTQIYDAATKYQEADLNLKLVPAVLERTKDAAVVTKLEALRNEFGKAFTKSRGRTEKFMRKLLATYDAEAAFTARLSESAAQWPADARRAIENERVAIATARGMLTYMYAGLFPDVKDRFGITDLNDENVDQISGGANIMLNQFYLRGYDESVLTTPGRR